MAPKRSPLEARLWLTAALAGGYVLAWLALSPGSAPPPESTTPEPSVGAAPPQVVWLTELPLAQRPVVVLPAGWTLDTGRLPAASTAFASQGLRAVPVPTQRRARVRTRSS